MPGSEASNLSRETIYSLFSDRRRRYLLSRLCETRRLTVSTLAGELAERERADGGPDHLSVRREIEIALVHDHLPRLAHCRVLEYTTHDDEIVVTRTFDGESGLLDDLEVMLGTE
ncbi:hypothetical protein [Natrialba sp. INN-245]|uniref:DUF7344 domain-containing protein n=1 Tax=Natrialba sp. INN-245 TaxID=2690967 RepID=UPI00130FEA1B|nr:hypothetical protein [Natrialba sp. INN-245]MWV40702.1 hypothetical protein [Natrialba sp. INN-245]